MKQVTSTNPSTATVETIESATAAPVVVKMTRKNRSKLPPPTKTAAGVSNDELSGKNQPSFKEKKRKPNSTGGGAVAAAVNSKNRSNNKKKRPEMEQPPPVVVTDIVVASAVPAATAADDDEAHHYEPQTVSVTSCLIVISIFVIGGAILFSIWEVLIVAAIHKLSFTVMHNDDDVMIH